jgi:hypothetical protein
LMLSSKVVIPAQAGIQSTCNYFKILDSRFHGNDKIECFATFDEFVKL